VAERTQSWLNRFRKLLVRFEKTTAGHEGLLELACALIAYTQVIPIYREALSLCFGATGFRVEEECGEEGGR